MLLRRFALKFQYRRKRLQTLTRKKLYCKKKLMVAHNGIGKAPMHWILRRSGALKFQKWAKDFKIAPLAQKRSLH